MAKVCRFVYLDKNGEESPIYTSALKNHPPDVAEDIYIKHMFAMPDIRYSLNPNAAIKNGDEVLDKFSKNLKRSDDKKHYENASTRRLYDGVSAAIEDLPIGSAGIEGLAIKMKKAKDANQTEEQFRKEMAESHWRSVAIYRDPKIRDLRGAARVVALEIAEKDPDYEKKWIGYT